MSLRHCVAPMNDIRRNSYFEGLSHLGKVARAGEYATAVEGEFSRMECDQQAVAESRVRGHLNGDGVTFSAPTCDGYWHRYEVLSVGRWYKCACRCPVSINEQADAGELKAKPGKGRFFKDR